MIKQDFTLDPSSVDVKPANGTMKKNGKQYVWEVRHAGLLGIKYEVAVRADLVEDKSVKLEGDDGLSSGKEVLRGVVDAAVLGSVQHLRYCHASSNSTCFLAFQSGRQR